jgi:hypothetical protein
MAEDRPTSTVNSEYATPPQSMLALDTMPLEPPRASFFSPGPSIGESSPRDSRTLSALQGEKESITPAHSTALLPAGNRDSESRPSQDVPRAGPFYRRPAWLAIALGALVALILVIVLPVTLTHKNHGTQSSKVSGNPTSSSTAGPTPTSGPKSPSNAITGGDGSTIISGGTSFIYNNSFGGFCEFFFTSNYLRIEAPDGRRLIACPCMRALCFLQCVCFRPILTIEGSAMAFMGFRRHVPGEVPNKAGASRVSPLH